MHEKIKCIPAAVESQGKKRKRKDADLTPAKRVTSSIDAIITLALFLLRQKLLLFLVFKRKKRLQLLLLPSKKT
jgi:hypothetical protein